MRYELIIYSSHQSFNKSMRDFKLNAEIVHVWCEYPYTGKVLVLWQFNG
jgi:hypothetical protein